MGVFPVSSNSFGTNPISSAREPAGLTKNDFLYSPQKFPSTDDYFKYLNNLFSSDFTGSHINQFIELYYRYSEERDQGQTQILENTLPNRNDNWISPEEMVKNPGTDGKIYGDCEDLALLFDKILSFGISGHAVIATPKKSGQGHVLLVYTRELFGKTTAYSIDSTGEDYPKPTDGKLRSTSSLPGESSTGTLKRHIDKILTINQDTSFFPFDPDNIKIDFLNRDGRAYTIPANLNLAWRYREIRKLLEIKDIENVIKIIDEEIKKAPQNINLQIARLQFLVTAGKNPEEVARQVDNLVSLFSETNFKPSHLTSILSTGGFLKKMGYKKESLALLGRFVAFHNAAERIDVNFNNFFSKGLIEDNQLQAAFEHDQKVLALIKSFPDITNQEELFIQFNSALFYRILDYPAFRQFLEGQKDLPVEFWVRLEKVKKQIKVLNLYPGKN